jgi:hypothetical protein
MKMKLLPDIRTVGIPNTIPNSEVSHCCDLVTYGGIALALHFAYATGDFLVCNCHNFYKNSLIDTIQTSVSATITMTADGDQLSRSPTDFNSVTAQHN